MSQSADILELELQSILADESFVFRVHNVKNVQVTHQLDLPQMFLAHYDSLPDEIKADTPLTANLLKKINLKMSANDANTLLGLPAGTIRPAHHIKITGTTVIVCDDLPLALHLNFTNTAKSSQALYDNDLTEMITNEADKWQMAGLVNVLHKSSQFHLNSQDMSGEILTIAPSTGFVQLPNAHALATTHTINTIKANTPDRLQFLHERIVDAVLANDGLA